MSLAERGERAQEADLGQLHTMGSWCIYLYWTLVCTAGLLRSHAHVQTDEYKSKHLPYFTTAEDGNEKQLVSDALPLSRNVANLSKTFEKYISVYINVCLQINDLYDVLERLQNNQIPALRKKHGYLPMVWISSHSFLYFRSHIESSFTSLSAFLDVFSPV